MAALAAFALALAGAAQLPGDGPVVLAVQPGRLADDVSCLNLAARTQPDVAAAEELLRDTLGFDPFKRADWVLIGVDPDATALAGLFSWEPAEIERVAAALAAGRAAPPAGYRHRVVVRIADGEKWKTFLGNLARTPWGRRVRASRDGELAVLDLVTAPGTLKTPAASAPRKLGPPLERPAAVALGQQPVAVYVQLERLAAMTRVDLLLEAAGRGRLPARAGKEVS